MLQLDVEALECENLDMMSDLFECNVEDLKISRSERGFTFRFV